MAISTIPNINGPNFGGVIYGLNLNINYSNSPSTLKLNIISKDGKYSIPNDWKTYSRTKVSVSFGNFKFVGFPWSYSLKETASERVLEVDLIDCSVILDRHYVLLWKRSIFDDRGELFKVSREIDISDETVLAPFWNLQKANIDFKETKLTKEVVERELYRAGRNDKGGSKKGNIIYLGREMFKPSRCDVPATYYYLRDLAEQAKTLKGVDLAPIADAGNDKFQGTYEGTLREVLSAWCSDLGFDFYWDFRNDRLKFFDSKNGIRTNLSAFSSLKSSGLLEKTISQSMQGTFKQYALAYTQKPKEALKVKTASFNFSILTTINPISPGWFLRKNSVRPSPQALDGEGDGMLVSDWGGVRDQDFLKGAVFCNYINQNLRNILLMGGGSVTNGLGELKNISEPEWNPMGMSLIQKLTSRKQQIVEVLKALNPEQLKNLETIDAEGIPNYEIALVAFDQGLLEKWQRLESDYLDFIGQYYRHTVNSGSFFYCTPTTINEISVTVDPEGTFYEGQNIDFRGYKIFNRGAGNISQSADVIQESLNINDPEVAKSLNSVLNVHVDLTTSLKQATGVSEKEIPENGIIILYPNNNLFKKVIQEFGVKLSAGINPLESTWADTAATNQNIKNNCLPFEEELRKNSCITAEEEARELALLKIMPPPDQTELFSGLVSAASTKVNINFCGNVESFYGPSYAPYYVVTRYTINVQKITNLEDIDYIYFAIDGGGDLRADDVEKIEVLFDNSTDPLLDTYGFKREDEIPTAKSVSNESPQQTVDLLFAGNPPNNIPMSITDGLSSIDISYSSDGFKTRLKYSSRPPMKPKNEVILRKMQSQINRSSFNSQ